MMTENPTRICCRTCGYQTTPSAEEPCLSCPTRLESFVTKWKPKPAPAEKARACPTCEHFAKAQYFATGRCIDCGPAFEHWEGKEPTPAPAPTRLRELMQVGSVWEYQPGSYNPHTIIYQSETRVYTIDKDGDPFSAYWNELNPSEWTRISPAPTPEPRTLASLGIKPGTRFKCQGAQWTLVNLGVRQDRRDYDDTMTDSFFDEAEILPDAQPQPAPIPPPKRTLADVLPKGTCLRGVSGLQQLITGIRLEDDSHVVACYEDWEIILPDDPAGEH